MIDERTVYLFARHNELNDADASAFVKWYFEDRAIAAELGNEPLDMAKALDVYCDVADHA